MFPIIQALLAAKSMKGGGNEAQDQNKTARALNVVSSLYGGGGEGGGNMLGGLMGGLTGHKEPDREPDDDEDDPYLMQARKNGWDGKY